MESAVSSLSSDLGQLGPSTTAREKSSTSTAAGCQGCENLRKNLLNVANQLSYMGQLQVQHSEGQKAVQQMTEQMAKHNIYVETLTDQIYNMKNQLRTAEMECETAKRREVEIQKHLDVLEQASAALRKKADTADMYENRYERAVAVCDVLQRKRLMISENLKALTDFAKKSKLDAESSKQDCERIKADKMAAMDKIRMYKKHVPNMLKVIDELAKRADSMPIHTRRKIDTLASTEIRLQLLGEHALTMSQEESVHEEEDADSSDDDMADDLETLIAGGVHASIRERSPVKARVAKKSPVKWRGLSESPKKTRELTESPMKERVQPRGESVRRGRGGWRGARRGATAGGHHNVDEAEKAFSAKLLSKLSKIEPTQPLSEVSGGHSTIHGKRGPTVREQQAKMMSVAEKVAMLRKEQDDWCSLPNVEHSGCLEPKKKAPEESLHAQQHTSKESTTSSSSDESSSPRRTRRKTPDWHSDLRLTPSPARLSPAHSLEALDNEQLLTTSEKPAFEELPPAPSVEAAPVEKVDGAYHAKPAARASTAATSKSLTSQLNQKSMAINRRLRAAANRPLPVAVAVKKAATKERIPAGKEDKKKIAEEGIQPDDEPGTSTVETKRIARGRKESTEKIPHPEIARSEEKAPKRAVTMRKTPSAKAMTVEAAPVPEMASREEKAFSAKLLSKLSKIDPTQPLSEGSGGHSTIHGKRGPTVREQQAKMMSVAEKVAMLRKEQDDWCSLPNVEHSGCLEPKKKAPEESLHAQQHTSKESTTSSSSDESSSPRRTRRKTPDWHSDLRLTPSPARLSPAHSLEALDNEQLLTTSEKPAFEELPPAPSVETAPVEIPPAPSVEAAPVELHPAPLVEAAPVKKVDGTDRARPAIRVSTATASKSLTSQLNQKSMAINRRLRAAANRPAPLAVKKAATKERIPAGKEDKKKIAGEGIQPEDEPGTSTVETKRIARGRKESTEKISHPEMASSEEKAPKRAVTVRRTLSAKSLTVEAAPVPKTTRQLKRKAAAEILPPKKLCLTASSAETLLKKVLDMDCAVEVLTKKIPAEELEQIKTIDAETFAAILMEHVLKMKSVDMWILVRNSCKKKSVDMLANKTEENLLQVAHTLSSTEGNVFRSFVRNLLFKIVSFPTLDALLCHRIVRLVAMVCVAQTQIREESEKDTAKEESRQQLEQLVKFLATKEPHLLGKSLVYLVNRLPAEYIHFLTQDDCTDVLRLVVLYSDDEVCRNLQAYWHAKLNSDLPLQKREEISAWVKENLAFGTISGGGTELLQELFQFRSVYFATPKTFSIALSESVDLLRLLESIFNTYKGDRPTDDIVASIFGGKSQKRLEDPDKVVIDELSERISTVIPLFDAVYRAESTIGRDRMRSFFRNLGSGVEMAHEILSLLSGHEDAAENRKLLVSTLSEFLRSCQPISRHKLL